MKKKLAIIGDVHGKRGEYLNITDKYEYTFQVGDMNFSYNHMHSLDPEKHKFIGGNHDNYSLLLGDPVPHYLGDFGTWKINDDLKIWFMRGAWSIDKSWRTPGIDWWPEEQLTNEQCEEAYDDYVKTKPDIVVTHDAPKRIYPYLGLPVYDGNLWAVNSNCYIPSRTPEILDKMLNRHTPKMWFFGHHHRSLNRVENGCKFICLPELGVFEMEIKDEKS